ncbi:MAG: TPM domain-containing protein [Cyclobacteriaceae bacterium]
MTSFHDRLDEPRIVQTIADAERTTSGEIRVHLERHCNEPVLDRAVEVFANLHMHQTKDRNGVLIYIAYQDQMFAIIGDAGINTRVEDDFWEREKDLLSQHFKQGQFTEGICKAISLIGERLQEYFPYRPDDQNELPNEVSKGD